MMTNHIADKDWAWRKFRLLRAFSSASIVAALFCVAVLFSFSSPAFAQQRIVVEKATGNIVDVGDRTLQYDSRYFDHMDFPLSPIPAGENIRKYMRDASGPIVLRPKQPLLIFDDDRRKHLILRINASTFA